MDALIDLSFIGDYFSSAFSYTGLSAWNVITATLVLAAAGTALENKQPAWLCLLIVLGLTGLLLISEGTGILGGYLFLLLIPIAIIAQMIFVLVLLSPFWLFRKAFQKFIEWLG